MPHDKDQTHWHEPAGNRKAGFGTFRKQPTPYDAFMESEGVPVFRDIGISKVQGYSQMQDAVTLATRYDPDVLCEEFIEGEEVTCPVLGHGTAALPRVTRPVSCPARGAANLLRSPSIRQRLAQENRCGVSSLSSLCWAPMA